MEFDVEIRDETIKLGQFIKLANLVETGGEAKRVIAEGLVTVNGEPDTRRGRTLHIGDLVAIEGNTARVAQRNADEEDDYFDEADDPDWDPSKYENLFLDKS